MKRFYEKKSVNEEKNGDGLIQQIVGNIVLVYSIRFNVNMYLPL